MCVHLSVSIIRFRLRCIHARLLYSPIALRIASRFCPVTFRFRSPRLRFSVSMHSTASIPLFIFARRCKFLQMEFSHNFPNWIRHRIQITTYIGCARGVRSACRTLTTNNNNKNTHTIDHTSQTSELVGCTDCVVVVGGSLVRFFFHFIRTGCLESFVIFFVFLLLLVLLTFLRFPHFIRLSIFTHPTDTPTDFFFWFIRWDRNRMTVRRCSIWLRTQLAIAICCKVLMWKREHPVLVRNSARHVFRIRNHRWEPKMFYKRTIKKAEKEILTSRYYKTNVQGYQLFPPASFSFAICGLSDIKLGRMMKFDEQKCSRLNWNW